MTNEELVKLYQKEDTGALDELIKNNTGMVNKIVNKYYSSKTNSIDREDLEQEGYIGLIIATGKYKHNIKNPAQFITYAVYWIRQKISRYLTQKNTNDEISLNTPYGQDDSMELQDNIEDENNSYLMIEERLYIKELREDLEDVVLNYTSLKEREVIKLKYGWNGNLEMTDKEVGQVFNLTKNQIADIRNRAFYNIRKSSWEARMAREMYIEKK